MPFLKMILGNFIHFLMDTKQLESSGYSRLNEMQKEKARLLAKGYKATQGWNFQIFAEEARSYGTSETSLRRKFVEY